MANAIVVFRGMPDSCSKCIGRFYCKIKTPKKCPIRPFPSADQSGMKDEYSQGWDTAVSRLLLLPRVCHRDFAIPVEAMECCAQCTTALSGPIGVPDNCPFKCFFASKTNCECFKGSFFKLLYQQPFPDKEGKPGKADYDAGYTDGYEWVMGQLGFEETERGE